MNKQNKSLEFEPSMDDILASIRSIISEDVQSSSEISSSEETLAQSKSKNRSGTDILDLTEMVREDGSVVTIQQEKEKRPTMMKQIHGQERARKPQISRQNINLEIKNTPPSTEPSDLISEEALSESMKALQGLETIGDRTLKEVGQAFNGSKSLETLMVDILRPMLREWIDANLPSLVKVIVNEQVEKVMKAR